MAVQRTVRVVHRIVLPVDRHGEISVADLCGPGDSPYLPGSTVVVDCGNGRWMYRSEVLRLADVLRHCGHVTVTGSSDEPARQFADHVVVGLEAIGGLLDTYLSASPLPAGRAEAVA